MTNDESSGSDGSQAILELGRVASSDTEAPAAERDPGTPPPLDERREAPLSGSAKVREWTYDPHAARRRPLGFPERS